MHHYLSGAAARLALLKRAHGDAWRRYVRFNVSPDGLSAGMNGKSQVWSTWDIAYLIRWQDCDEVNSRINHRGWYCDSEGRECARGIVVRLPHGRFMPGYRTTDAGEIVVYAEILDNDSEAAWRADRIAELYAEDAREYAAQWEAAQALQNTIDEQVSEIVSLREQHSIAIIARKMSRKEVVTMKRDALARRLRHQASQLVESLRDNRQKMARDFAGVL